MQHSVALLWLVIPSLLGRNIVPDISRHELVKRFSYSYSYGYVYCNPGTYYAFYACPCNSISTILCCCPYDPSLPYPTSPYVRPPPATVHPIPLNGKIQVLDFLFALLVALHALLL